MIDRRTLIAGAGIAAITPVFSPALDLFDSPLPPQAPSIPRPVFMIQGWSVPSDSGTADEVWIRVGHSWRTAWR